MAKKTKPAIKPKPVSREEFQALILRVEKVETLEGRVVKILTALGCDLRNF